MEQPGCLTSDELALFVSGELPATKREALEIHLSNCRICRRSLVSTYEGYGSDRVTARAPAWLKAVAVRLPATGLRVRPLLHRPRFRLAAALAAMLLVVSATTVLLFSIRSQPGRRLPAGDAFRQGVQIIPRPRLLAPPDGKVVALDQVDFLWSRVAGASRYTLTILDDKGDIVFQAPSADAPSADAPSADAPSAEERLAVDVAAAGCKPEKSYFWYVTVASSDGTGSDSEVGRFSIGPH